MAIAVLLTLASFCSIAQQSEKGEVWASPMAGISTLNGDSKVCDRYGVDANALSSYSGGFELGYNFSKSAYMFFTLEDERASMSEQNKHFELNSINASYNFAYTFLRSSNGRFDIGARVGVGVYNSRINFASELLDVPVETKIVTQNWNVYLPVGLTFESKFTENSKLRVSLLYRHSFDTGTSKNFGVEKTISDYPFNKLSSFYLTVGYTFGI